ncbi:uncharacterized protein LOC112241355 [Oncorhynchus tshawytscha]|uniref:uncharacterized protein LOC112241355 n=1 Tax=Oncorhynchus tshawytscha TaxID=74940 RepID=UPI001C3D400A|nr:uncharacterized protein LOC112241355 [Oncorhynchus tshawytscha]
MALRTAGSVLVVFLWSVAVLLGQDGRSVKYITQSICTLKGSTVELSCSYTYPSGTVTTTFCFTRNDAEGNPVTLSDEPDYTGHVTYCSNKKNGHTLTIRDLRECDSAMCKVSILTLNGTHTPLTMRIRHSGMTRSHLFREMLSTLCIRPSREENHHRTWTEENHHRTWTEENHHRTWTEENHHRTWTEENHHRTWTEENHHRTWTKENHHRTWTKELWPQTKA